MKSRQAYYVQSPSNHEADKASFGSGPSLLGSPTYPTHHHHHRDSSSSYQFTDNLQNQNPRPYVGYTSLQARQGYDYDDDEMDCPDRRSGSKTRFYFCLFLLFVVLFTTFCLILWGVSKSYRPIISLKGMVFHNFDVQAGSDDSGVATDMLTLNSTVRILYRNPATFFSVHVSSTPLEISYFRLKLANGQIEKFTQKRKSQRRLETVVQGNQVPLYGGIPVLLGSQNHPERISLPLNLTFTVRSTAHILGQLVKSKFRSDIRCLVSLQGGKLGKSIGLTRPCSYES